MGNTILDTKKERFSRNFKKETENEIEFLKFFLDRKSISKYFWAT